MKAYIAKNFMGVFAFDENGKLIEKVLFPPRPEDIAEKLSSRPPEEERLIRKLKGYEIDRGMGNKGEEFLRKRAREMALKLGFVKSNAEYNQFLSRVNVLLTKEKMRVKKADRIIMQAIGVADEIDRVLNVFVERLREWYALYFPEAERTVGNHEKFVEMVSKGRKEKIQDKEIKNLIEGSAGMDFSPEDLKQLQFFSKTVLGMFHVKKELGKYIDKATKETTPNLSAVAGPVLAAKLLASAGGLEKLAKFPSSAIQLLGAEKALFRHLKGKGKAPKYGIIFAHPLVQNAPKEKKGKVARIISAKLSLAAKTDYFKKEDKGQELKKDMEEKIKRLT